MAVMKPLSRVPKAVPAVLAIAGADRRHGLERLRLEPGLRFTATPRDANVLLVAGDIGDRCEALEQVHDQLPHPRATLWVDCTPVHAWPGSSQTTIVEAADAIRSLSQSLLSGACESEPDCLPDEPPVPWRGVGPHGQGGKGMMGGTPYGRPMAMTGDDLRDGLQLDMYKVKVGPFLALLPDGLQLQFSLQGDVVQSVRVLQSPLPQRYFSAEPSMLAARLLRLLDLPDLAERSLRTVVQAASSHHQTSAALTRLLIRLSGAILAIPHGLAQLDDGSDARERFIAWTQGQSIPRQQNLEGDGNSLPDMLRGLEWQEAMLAINSLPPPLLIHWCDLAMSRQAAEEQQDEENNS